MTTNNEADHGGVDWETTAETALVAGLAYAGAVTAAAMVAAAGDSIFVVGAASVCIGALGALVGMAAAALARVLYRSEERHAFAKIGSAVAYREAGLPAGAGD